MIALQLILFSALAGIFGMGFGGLLSIILLKRPSENMVCWLLSFAAGVMVSIVCFGLIPESFTIAGIKVSIFGLILGIVILMGLNYLVDKITISRKDKLKIHSTHKELYHEGQLIKNPARILRSGIVILLAISLHNVPEGIAIGAGGSHDYSLGVLLALMIAVHNIPEGMAIAAPLLAGGISKKRVVFLTSLSGATTLLGGLIGILIGSISDFAIAISMSAAGGTMLYVVFGEIIPQSIIMTKNRAASVITLFGIIIGLVVTQI